MRSPAAQYSAKSILTCIVIGTARIAHALHRFFILVAVSSLAAIASAQGSAVQIPPIDQPPPPIVFSDWKEVPTDTEDTNEYRLSFPSAITTPYPENNAVPVRVILPSQRDKPLPVVIILHYWGATDLRVETQLAGELTDRGIGAVIVTLPYHLGRTPPGYRSGQLAIQPDPKHLVVTLTQAVLDVRRTIDFLYTKPEIDKSKIGIAGTSLGSLVSILSFAVDSRISVGTFVLGGIDLAHIIWHSSRIVDIRDELRRRGYTEARLRTEIASVEPGRYLPSRRSGETFVIGGRYDTVIPGVDTQKLVTALPNAKVLWLDTGHYGGIFVERRLLRTVAEYFEKQFAGQSFTPPLKIYAPTVRVGALANTDSGVQVGAGIDLVSFDRKGDVFSTLLVTPKGLLLFTGARIAHGLAIGGFASRRKLSIGAWWSTVL